MEQMKRRRRLDESAWRAVLERFGQSELSVADFCQREGLGAASFYRWRSILDAKGDGQSKQRAEVTPRPEEPEFLDLGTVAGRRGDLPRMEVRVDLGGGVVLQVIRG